MIAIKINIKILILSILIALLMYPKTIDFLMNSGKNIYIARKLSSTTVQNHITAVNPNKTKIVFMFDDGWKSVYSEAYDIMQQYDYKGSISIIPSLVDNQEYMSYEELAEVYLDGWDLLNHSYSHKENVYHSSDELLSDFNRGRQWMKNRYLGRDSDMVVMPHGEVNPYLIGQLKDAGYRNVRTSDNIIIMDSTEYYYYPITAISLLSDMPAKEVKDLLIQTSGESKTVILILHKIDDLKDGYGMTYSKNKLEEIIIFINENRDEFQVVTYSQLFW